MPVEQFEGGLGVGHSRQTRQSGVIWVPEHLRLSFPLDHCHELLRGQVLIWAPLHLVGDYRAPTKAVAELADTDAVGSRRLAVEPEECVMDPLGVE